MAIKRDRAVLRQVSTLFNVGVIRDLTDGQLLERFSTGQGEAAELAFAALVDRHGPMVLRVCRTRLSDPHDAMDAFQATFLVLVEKARGLWVRDSLGPWLHAVAFRTASCARSAAARRRRVERRAAESATGEHAPDPGTGPGWEQVLHEEINRLPERYRVPIVLCDLEGNTCEEAARRMGRPVGTVKSWRARGRDRLRQRLTRSGLAPSIGLGAALAAGVARASTPEAEEAVRALLARMTAGVVPASVGVLVRGVIKAMLLKRIGTTAAVVWALVFVAVGVGSVARVAAEDPKKPREEVRGAELPGQEPRPAGTAPAGRAELHGEAWSLSLGDAIRIGLKNARGVRIVPPDVMDQANDGSLVVTPEYPGVESHQFKAEVMAAVRSIDDAYWGLSQKYVQLWAEETAIRIVEEVHEGTREAMKLGRRTTAEVAEAGRWLEERRLHPNSVSDVITCERRLRDVLGLPPADGRRIVPVTVPVEAKLEPDWEECLAAMLENQPDVARAKEKPTAKSVDVDAITRTFLSDLGPATTGAAAPERRSPGEQGTTVLEQTTREATRKLGKFFLSIGENYKQYQAAKKQRAAALERLAAQRAHYDEGRITFNECLEAVDQYNVAVLREAMFKAFYNLDIVSLEEAKGTLLEYAKITVAQTPRAVKPVDGGGIAASIQPPAPAPPAPATPLQPRDSRAREDETKAAPEPPTVADAGRTISFQATISVGSLPIEIRGSFTVGPDAPLKGVKAP